MRSFLLNELLNKLSGFIHFIKVFLVLLTVLSCSKKANDTHQQQLNMPYDSIAGIIIADTTTFDVVIKIKDHEDPWQEHSLGKLDKKKLVDLIFKMASEGPGSSFDYNTGEKLSGRDIQQLEDELNFNRDDIGMIQFNEIWYINSELNSMTKKVHSIILGYEYYSADSILLGHKPLFEYVFYHQ